MATERTHRGKGGTAKYGRNADKCKAYKLNHTREKNKLKNLRRQIKRLPEGNMQRAILEKRVREIERILKGEE